MRAESPAAPGHSLQAANVFHRGPQSSALHPAPAPRANRQSLVWLDFGRETPAARSPRAVSATALHRSKENGPGRSEEHTSELQSRGHLVCRLLLEKKNRIQTDKY